MMQAMEKIAWIGVGKMGLPMATHLRDAGHSVIVTDPDPARLALAQEADLKVATNLSQAIDGASLICSSLPNDDALLHVATQLQAQFPSEQSANNAEPVIWVDTSTVSPEASSHVAQLLAKSPLQYLRSTVSGNNHMAQARQLTFMASGPSAAWERVKPVIAAFAPNSFYLGQEEQARLMKLVVNLMIVQTSAMLGEALALGKGGGLDWQQMWQVICASAVASPIVKAKAEQLSVHDYTATFTVDQMMKDVELILRAGETASVALPQTQLTREALGEAQAQGMAQDDYASVIRLALEIRR